MKQCTSSEEQEISKDKLEASEKQLHEINRLYFKNKEIPHLLV